MKRDAEGISETGLALVWLGYMTSLALVLGCGAASGVLWTVLSQTSVVT